MIKDYKVDLITEHVDPKNPARVRFGESPTEAFTKFNNLVDYLDETQVHISSVEPTDTKPFFLWLDTSKEDNPKLKVRSSDNKEWLIPNAMKEKVEYVRNNEITSSDQYIIAPDGNTYVIEPSVKLPYRIKGDWGSDASSFWLGNDATLRAQLSSASGSEIVGFVQDGVASVRKSSDKLKDFGANLLDYSHLFVGNDATEAAKAWISSSHENLYISGSSSYEISQTLVSTLNGRKIDTKQATLIGTTSDMTLFRIEGENTELIAKVDGNKKCATAVFVTAGGCKIHSGSYINIHGEKVGSSGVRSTTLDGIRVYKNHFELITATGNGTLGDGPGSARAVVITGTEDARKKSFVISNTCVDIQGEEGDAIQVLFTNNGSLPYSSGKVVVKWNDIYNANRRSVKIQAADCTVQENDIENTLLKTDHPNLTYLIDVISSPNTIVKANRLRSRDTQCLQVTGSGHYISGIDVSENKFFLENLTRSTSYFEYIENSRLDKNEYRGGGAGMAIGRTRNTSVCSNDFYDGGSFDAISAVANCSDLKLCDNNSFGGTRTSTVNNSAKDSLVQRNHNSTGTCVISASTSVGSIVTDNTNKSTSPTLGGNFTGVKVGNNYNIGLGPSATGLRRGAIYRASSAPTSWATTQYFTTGDIVLNTNPKVGDPLGWACISDGTPGTWIVISTIT